MHMTSLSTFTWVALLTLAAVVWRRRELRVSVQAGVRLFSEDEPVVARVGGEPAVRSRVGFSATNGR